MQQCSVVVSFFPPFVVSRRVELYYVVDSHCNVSHCILLHRTEVFVSFRFIVLYRVILGRKININVSLFTTTTSVWVFNHSTFSFIFLDCMTLDDEHNKKNIDAYKHPTTDGSFCEKLSTLCSPTAARMSQDHC